MTKQRSQRNPQRKPSRPRWSMFPTMHQNVSRLLEDEGLHFKFHNSDEDVGTTKAYDTSIMGRFLCPNQDCPVEGWASMRIAITIRMYEGDQYNARVYYQRCRACQRLSKPILDDSYAERVAYRLKKWSGVEQELPKFSGESKGPHIDSLCEGCKAGHCSQGGGIDGMAEGLSRMVL